MKSRTSWLLLILMVSLGLYAAYLHPWTPPVRKHGALPPPANFALYLPPFTMAQYDAFSAAARKAETVSDPLQRCLAYPNPPGLHWSDTVTSAYCHFKYDSWISRKNAERLIRTGHADELDKRLTAALHAQLASPGLPGALDHTLYHDFGNSKPSTRKLIEAWKRQRPNSAFAWTASGMAYLMSEYPGQDTATRHQFLSRARADLEHAVKLDPRITHAYASMIDVGRIEGDRDFALQAAHRGLAVDSSNFTLYTKMALLAEPEWGGSEEAVKSVVREARRHSAGNPLLTLLDSFNFVATRCMARCQHCGPDFDNWLYNSAFDHGAPVYALELAGCGAQHRHDLRFAVIYHSEAYRFDVHDTEQLEARGFNLIDLGRLDWALASAESAVKEAPDDNNAYDVRGAAYENMRNYPLAVASYRKAVQLDAHDGWARDRLLSVQIMSKQESAGHKH